MELKYLQCQKEIYLNAYDLLKESQLMFENRKYSRSTFLASIAIEEVAKCIKIRSTKLSNNEDTNIDWRKFIHYKKALEAVTYSLAINSGADKRHGIHPISKMHKTSGLIRLIKSDNWMGYHNRCLYVDINKKFEISKSPKCIGEDLAYYFICMTYEILLESIEAGLESENAIYDFMMNLQDDLNKFMYKYNINVDELEFLKYPERYKIKPRKKTI